MLLICFAVTAAGALTYFYVSAERRPTLDPVSLCPTTGPKGISVILVDTSDDLKDTTQREILGILEDQIVALRPYHKLDIRILDIQSQKSRSLFSKCNPGDGEGLSEWTDNPTVARMRWIENFKKPAAEAVKGSLSKAQAASSPIMAAIQDIAIDQFSSSSVQSISKSLFVISDMIEFTRDYSQYPSAGDLSYERFKRSAAYQKFRTDLHNASVKIAYAYRQGVKIDGSKHLDFWGQWIDDNRGKREGVKRLQGAN